MNARQPAPGDPSAKAAPLGRMVVARFFDGRTIKGTTHDFLPHRADFHVYQCGDERSTAVKLSIDELKAVFFVKSLEGRKEQVDHYDFETTKGYGRRCRVTFHDGETVDGYTTGYSAARPGFFVIPAAADNNNERIFVVNKSVRQFAWL